MEITETHDRRKGHPVRPVVAGENCGPVSVDLRSRTPPHRTLHPYYNSHLNLLDPGSRRNRAAPRPSWEWRDWSQIPRDFTQVSGRVGGPSDKNSMFLDSTSLTDQHTGDTTTRVRLYTKVLDRSGTPLLTPPLPRPLGHRRLHSRTRPDGGPSSHTGGPGTSTEFPSLNKHVERGSSSSSVSK